MLLVHSIKPDIQKSPRYRKDNTGNITTVNFHVLLDISNFLKDKMRQEPCS